jgi:hypothetical protein
MFIVFLISPAVTRLLLKINIGGMSIKEHISSSVTSAIGEDIASQTFISDIVNNLPNMIANIITTILLLIIVGLLCKLIVAIVTKIFFKKEKSKEKSKVFSPPSFQDVNDYCTERHNGVDPQAFIDFYTSKGWMVGKTKMRDWKAAIRTWERRDADSIRSTRISQQDINKAKVEDFFRRNIGGL